MAEIIASLEPGQYNGAQTVTVTFPPNTRKAIITRDDRAPVLTEILAYDQGPIVPGGASVQRPFIAVTQDGRGNVTFDGGFPKFYNTHIPAQNGGSWPALPYTSWSQVQPAVKYLNNCVKFCANPRKLGLGNRKVLLINTARASESYNADLSYRTTGTVLASSCFKDTFQALGQLGNWDITTRGFDTAGGKFNLDLAYLDQFACVIFMGTAAYDAPPSEAQRRVTEACAKDLSLYRMNGNGVILITDHTNKNFTNINDAQNGFIFSPDVNRVAKYYSAYFSGDVDRSPVLVSEIRRQLIAAGNSGNHPLFDGLADSEYIFAGGSESLVQPQLFDGDIVPANQPYVVNMATAGTYRINALIQLEDGTILTKPMRYVIINPSDILVKDTLKRTVNDSSSTYKPVIDYTVDPGTGNDITLQGKIMVDSMLVGYFKTTVAAGVVNTTYSPFSGPNTPMPVSNGQTVKFVITEPFEYTLGPVINIPDGTPYFITSGGIATFTSKLLQHPYFSGVQLNQALGDITSFADKCFTTASRLGTTILGLWWKVMGKARLPFTASELLPARLRVYANDATWLVGKPAVGQVGDAVIIADTNQVYYWDDLPIVWVAHTAKANALFNVGRKVVNTLDNSNWIIGENTTVTA